MKIQDQSVVVTGGASGLGLATARLLAQSGASTILVDLDVERGKAIVEDLSPRAYFVRADVTNTEDFSEALNVAESTGVLRAVVHCAGRGGDRNRILNRDGEPGNLDSFGEVVRVNLIGTYNVLRLSAARMGRNEPCDGDRGVIILTASAAAFEGQIGQTAYAASKAAIHGITLVAARDLASSQIRVNTIAPGIFDTPMMAGLREDIRESLAALVPHPKRLGDPTDYAHLALSLIENPYINGETVRIDGAVRLAPR